MLSRLSEFRATVSKWLHDEVLERIDAEALRERELRCRRNIEFARAHPSMARIPIVGALSRVMYGHGAIQVLALVAIVSAFTMIKAPYFSLSFTGEHALKYNTYVEPALYMSLHNDPLRFQAKYVANPVWNPQGMFDRFRELPLLPWGLYLTYELVPVGSLEEKTRWFTHAIGILILCLAYVFFQGYVPSTLALLVVGLAALTPVVALTTYVTVNDSLTIALTFAPLIALKSYLDGARVMGLFWAGILSGIAVSVKYSAFLWLMPIAAALIYTESHARKRALNTIVIYVVLTCCVVAITFTGIAGLPGNFLESTVVLGLWLVGLGLVAKYFEGFVATSERMIGGILDGPAKSAGGALILLATAGASLLLMRPWRYGHYLSDWQLLLQFRLYTYMAWEQFRFYVTPIVFYSALVGMAIPLTSRWTNVGRLCGALILGSMVYWVLAAKAMFFHSYYTVIIAVTLCLGAGITIYYVLLAVQRPVVKIGLAALFAVIIVPRAVEATHQWLALHEDIAAVSRFVESQTEADDILLHEGRFSSLTIYTGRPLVRTYQLQSDEFRHAVQQLGFQGAMHKYHVRYLMTTHDEPRYEDFIPVLDDAGIQPLTYNRKYLICKTVRLACAQADHGTLADKVEALKIKGRFELVKQVGKFRFFEFRDRPK